MHRTYRNFIFVLLALLLLGSCSESPKEQDQKKAAETTTTLDKSAVLATVNGSSVTVGDLEFSINKLFGAENAVGLDAAARRKILESVVMSRAIAQAQQKSMDKTAQTELENEVRAFREQALVRRYLAAKVPPKPVTMEMVRDYYDLHPEQFGAKQVLQYEMLSSKRPLGQQERDELLVLLAHPDKQKNWQKWSGDIGAKGYPVVYSSGNSNAPLHQKLVQVMKGLQKGQTSSVIMIDKTPYIIRVTDSQTTEPRPISEVAETIRKALVPQRLKEAIVAAGKDVLANSKVEYK